MESYSTKCAQYDSTEYYKDGDEYYMTCFEHESTNKKKICF